MSLFLMSLFCHRNLFEDIFYRLYFQCLSLETKMCWGVIFLLGGGFALASASQKSGLSGKMVVNILRTTCFHGDSLPRWRSIFGGHVFTQWHFTKMVVNIFETTCFHSDWLPRWRSIFGDHMVTQWHFTKMVSLLWGPHVYTVTHYQDGVITLRTMCLHSDTSPRWGLWGPSACSYSDTLQIFLFSALMVDKLEGLSLASLPVYLVR